MAKKSTIKSNWPKYVLQWGVLALILFFVTGLFTAIFGGEPADPEKYCPFGGIQALATYIQRASLPCSMTTVQIIMGAMLTFCVILFSKLFCGYLCPIGSVEDLLKKLRNGINIKGIVIKQGSVIDKILRVVKYGLLFWIAYNTIGASELFCKNLDPYYAVATGFKGEITLWMSIISVSVVLLLGLFIDRFWCKYICPLGAVSNTFKFWAWVIGLFAVWYIIVALGVSISWVWLLGAFCVMGYLLEIINGKPKYQVLAVVRDEEKCGKTCFSCMKNCPYGINVPEQGVRVNHVDCVLCGECIAACPTKALTVSTCKPCKCGFNKYVPAIIAVVLTIAAFLVGKSFELPTIDESWNMEKVTTLESFKMGPLPSVKCFSSSMAFKARMEAVAGVHGVKTYVGSHTVEISYDPTKTDEEKIKQEVFTPSKFRVNPLEPTKYTELKVVTIRTEHMYDKLDLNNLGMQFRLTGKEIYGVDSQYDCPLKIRLYMAPEETIDEAWCKETVEKKSVDLPLANGKVNSTPVDFEFVRLEEEVSSIDVNEYLYMMFDGFSAEYSGKYAEGDTTVVKKRVEVYAEADQFIFEIVDPDFEKPIVKRYLPYLSNHISREEGIIGTYLKLNKDMLPAVQIRFAAPATADRIWELMTMPTWTITYSADDVREESAKLGFEEKGVVYPYEK